MLKEIHSTLNEELEQVNHLIQSCTKSEVGLVQQIGAHCLQQPGRKMVRPSIILLLANTIGVEDKRVIELATIIELVHIATILHDDVIDAADIRRSKPSMFSLYGSKPSVLMGDFVYACAFRLIGDLHSTEITALIAKATKRIIEGEILQYSMRNNPNTSINDYNFIIDAKTACLFEVGAHCVGTLSSEHAEQLKKFGWHFGMAYQISDDLLDINVANSLNKSHGKDLSEGQVTLPTIYARQYCTDEERVIIDEIVAVKRPWQDILPILNKTNTVAHCKKVIASHIKKAKAALMTLPDNTHREHLLSLVDNLPKRNV